MRSIGVGIVGLGFGARVQLPGFRRLEDPGVHVTALCARDGAPEAAAEAGVPRAYDDWRALVADDDVDLVSVATPPLAHHEIALGAIRAGKAVLCEKPLAVTVAEAEELAAAASQAGVPALVDFEFRGVPAFRKAQELLAEDAIGRVLQLDVAWHIPSRLGLQATDSRSWKDSAEAGGGALLALGVHSLDYVEWLLGPVSRLAGWAGSLLGRASSDDACAALLELEDGTPVTLSISTVAAAGQGHVLRFLGESGSLTLANPELADYMRSFRLERDGEPAFVPEPTGEDGRIAPFAELARELVAAIREGREPVPSFREGARAQRLADAVRRSGTSDAWLTV